MALNPLSERTRLSIREWIHRCEAETESSHKVCSLSEANFVPSRLVQIQLLDHRLHVRLVRGIDVHARETLAYSTLSYCWGSTTWNSLTRARYHTYMQEIPWQDLPKTLQDAVITSYRLGIPYIWIDSLCILQDDETEKSREIGMMTKVYTHARFTIMARRGNNASDGFLSARTLPPGSSCLQLQTGFWVRLVPKFAMDIEDDRSLDERGWVAQEHILSRRLVIFGTYYTTWSCRTERNVNLDGWYYDSQCEVSNPFQHCIGWASSASKTCTVAAVSTDESDLLHAIMFLSANPSYQHHQQPKDLEVYHAWTALIETYTTRLLSKESDRPLAISGLAERFSCVIPNCYIGGIWEAHLPGALVWRAKNCVARPVKYQGPSWSWVSVNSPICFKSPMSSASLGEAVSWVASIQYILDDPSSPYGSVSNAVLNIEGPALAIEWQYTRDNSAFSYLDRGTWRFDKNDAMRGRRPTIFLDAREPSTGWTEIINLAVTSIADPHLADSYECIVLMKAGDCKHSRGGGQGERYRRLGLFHLDLCDRTTPPFPDTKEWAVRSFTVI